MKKKEMIKAIALPASAYLALTVSGAIVQAEEVAVEPEAIVDVEMPVEAVSAEAVIVEEEAPSLPADLAPVEETPAEPAPIEETVAAPVDPTVVETPLETAPAPVEEASAASTQTTTVTETNAATNVQAEDPIEEKEEYREQYHFSNEKGWSNDPNGLVYYNGEWHLFFQYYPDGVNHGAMSWGHAISNDLVHWNEVAVSPTFDASAYDSTLGTRRHFSGSIVHDINNTSGFFNGSPNGGLVAVWTVSGRLNDMDRVTGGGSQRQAIAYSTDGMHWTEPDLGIERLWLGKDGQYHEMSDTDKDYYKNVVLAEWNVVRKDGNVSDDPLANSAFRDPKVFWHEPSQQWIMAVAGGPVRFYSSKDLKSWQPEAMQDEIITECPELYYLPVQGTNDHKYVLSEGGRWYQIGDFKEVDGKWTFVPEVGADGTPARFEMNYAPDAYAAQSFYDANGGRVIMIQWMSNWSYADNSRVKNPDGTTTTLEGIRKVLGEEHNGQFTLPAELYLVQTPYGLRMAQKPVAELDELKNAKFNHKDVTIDDQDNVLKDLHSQQFQMEIEFEPEKGTDEVVLEILKNSQYETKLIYNVQTQTLTVDRSNSMSAEKAPADHMQNGTWWKFLYAYSAPVPMENGKVKLHIYVDNYSLEVYANDYTTVLTLLVFPDKDATSMNLYATGTPVKANISFATMDSYRNPNIDMRDLTARLEELKPMMTENKGYTPETYDLFTQTYNNALKSVFHPDSTQDSINASLAALNKAHQGLALDMILPEEPSEKPSEKPSTPADEAKAEETKKEEAKPVSTLQPTRSKSSPNTGIGHNASMMGQMIELAGAALGLGFLKKRRNKK